MRGGAHCGTKKCGLCICVCVHAFGIRRAFHYPMPFLLTTPDPKPCWAWWNSSVVVPWRKPVGGGSRRNHVTRRGRGWTSQRNLQSDGYQAQALPTKYRLTVFSYTVKAGFTLVAGNNGTVVGNAEEAQFTAISVGETDHRVGGRSHRHGLKRRPIETRMRWTHHEPSSRGRHQRRWAHSCTRMHKKPQHRFDTYLSRNLKPPNTHTHIQKEIGKTLVTHELNRTSPI